LYGNVGPFFEIYIPELELLCLLVNRVFCQIFLKDEVDILRQATVIQFSAFAEAGYSIIFEEADE